MQFASATNHWYLSMLVNLHCMPLTGSLVVLLPEPSSIGPLFPMFFWVFTFPEKPAATFDAFVEFLVVAHIPSIYERAGDLPVPHSHAVCTANFIIGCRLHYWPWVHGFRTGYNHK